MKSIRCLVVLGDDAAADNVFIAAANHSYVFGAIADIGAHDFLDVHSKKNREVTDQHGAGLYLWEGDVKMTGPDINGEYDEDWVGTLTHIDFSDGAQIKELFAMVPEGPAWEGDDRETIQPGDSHLYRQPGVEDN